jgi:hypothetical protein
LISAHNDAQYLVPKFILQQQAEKGNREKALLFISNVTFGEAPLRRTPETPSCRVFHKIYFDMEKIYSD